MRVTVVPAILLLAISACPSSPGSPPSPAVTGAPAAPSASPDAAALAPATAALPATPTLLAYHGTIGAEGEFRMALERTGDRLEGVYTTSGEQIGLRGDVTAGTHFTLAEVVPKGRAAATFEGTMEGPSLRGTWTAPKAAAVAFTATANELTGPENVEQTYLGALGSRLHIRVRLKKSRGTLSGVYRYTRSREDLHLDGTVTEPGGMFELRESNALGVKTGTFKGVLLDVATAYGRWSSPDGTRTLPFTLRGGEAFPEPESLPGGVKVIPQEDYVERGNYCTSSIFVPEVTGASNAGAQKMLNQALKTEAGGTIDCSEASEQLRYERDVSYAIEARRPGLFALRLSFYDYGGGAHGMHGERCYAADLDKGTLTSLHAKLLGPDARKKIQAFVVPEVRKMYVADGMEPNDQARVSDETTLCVASSAAGAPPDLFVQFGEYEVGPYAMGSPSVKIARADSIPLVAGTPLEPFFKGPQHPSW